MLDEMVEGRQLLVTRLFVRLAWFFAAVALILNLVLFFLLLFLVHAWAERLRFLLVRSQTALIVDFFLARVAVHSPDFDYAVFARGRHPVTAWTEFNNPDRLLMRA